ncbi:MAG: hypothetical protein ACXVXN_05020 [Mycobacteriaceae bacterium]
MAEQEKGRVQPHKIDPNTGQYAPPLEGWLDFGAHAALDSVPRLTFSDEHGDDGMPLWERHDGCTCDLDLSAPASTQSPTQPRGAK